MNPDSLTPEPTALTNTPPTSLSVQGVFMKMCAERGPTRVQKLGSHETVEFYR